ncbi:hypothetical protein WJX73_001989 [Symbiochloris irregularis]|uniref:SRP54-type proteins GTP-binding domain-containing protein n=1 Tax=Symbiochloris irregularis TaxID=706552 RepID=A0AAW1P0K0_9CHLO
MLDHFCVFTKGGALLWTWQMTALRGNPIDALVRTCLLEERSGDDSFTYSPPAGVPYTLKWTLHNGLGLVFVAVYQRSLKLLYVDALLKRVKADFSVQYSPKRFDYAAFDETFRSALREAEAQVDAAKRPGAIQAGLQGQNLRNRKPGQSGTGRYERIMSTEGDDSDDDEDSSPPRSDAAPVKQLNDLSLGPKASNGNNGSEAAPTTDKDSEEDGKGGEAAFDVTKLKGKGKRGLGGRPMKAPKSKAKEKAAKDTKKTEGKKKAQRRWTQSGSEAEDKELDFSEKPDGSAVPSESENGFGSAPDLRLKSRVDVEDDDELDDDEAEPSADQNGGAQGGGGLLSSFVGKLGMSMGGTAGLTRQEIQPALVQLKRKLMERNVAEEIAEKLCESVAANLVGQKLGSFRLISTAVKEALEAALTRILTPKRSIDVLREVHAARARGKPYTMVFVGVNGVGKSTNLAKIAYWLLQNKVKVMIAACDTFRAGAVEQLKTHCARLNVPLYERGYEKDPAKVAFEAIRAAERAKCDVLLVDTAGRMQDNEPLMRALSGLISLNEPDLVLFVGEALVGNDAVDQLTKFGQRLADLATGPNPHTIDGILLTKFDTIDDKVGAALSMVYTSGAPIMFVGCGQTYPDLTRLNVKAVVRSLLK